MVMTSLQKANSYVIFYNGEGQHKIKAIFLHVHTTETRCKNKNMYSCPARAGHLRPKEEKNSCYANLYYKRKSYEKKMGLEITQTL